MTANLIAENMMAQIDKEGNLQKLLFEIKDHRRDESAIPVSQGTFETKQGIAWMGILCAMEGWLRGLGRVDRFEGILPSGLGRLCHYQ